MKRSFVTAYSIVAFAVLAAAALWFAFSVFSEAKRGSEEAERTFSWLCRETAQNSYSLGFMSDAYIEEITGLCQTISTLIAMTISSPAETFYAWPENSPALANTEGLVSEIRRTSLFSKVMSANVDMGANASPAISVTASIRTLSPSVIFAVSRNSFILVFLVLLSSIIILLVMPEEIQITEKSSKGESLFPEENEKADYDYMEEYADGDKLSDGEYSNMPETEYEYPEAEAALDSATDGDATPNSFSDELGNARENIQAERSFLAASELGLERHLQERLNAELILAASAERDVSILILRIFDMDHADKNFRAIGKIVADIFKRRDMIFEFGADACACIIPGATLDKTMQAAEHLYTLVCNFLAETSLNNRVCIGISTRMARDVAASKMIKEADTAARKAEEEERLPIVAFRANPENYRDYAAKNITEMNTDL